MAEDARWQRTKEEHAGAVSAFLAAAEAVPEARWNEARGEGKWSPAQIAEHLRLTYATVSRDLRGETGFRVRVGPLRLLVLRLTVLRRMLRERAFPKGAPAVREVRPAGGPFDRQPTLAGLRAEAESFMRGLDTLPGRRARRFTHPFFGRLAPQQGLELMVLHTHHHRGQLTQTSASAAGDPAGAAHPAAGP